MAYDNTNTGLLMKNEEMRPDKKDPGYKGSINVEGVEYWLSAWVNEGKDGSAMEGKKYFSLKLQKKEPKGAKKAPPKDDDIPF